MASQAKFSIRVQANRGSSRVSYSTNGKYISLQTNGISDDLVQQPVLTTASAKAFWLAVLAIVQADVEAMT
jgi:hypothetical protein